MQHHALSPRPRRSVHSGSKACPTAMAMAHSPAPRPAQTRSRRRQLPTASRSTLLKPSQTRTLHR